VKTVAGGRHASYFADDVEQYFDAVVLGDPEGNIPAVVEDARRGQLKKRYALPSPGPQAIEPSRYDLIDFKHNRIRLPGIEASRGCPFTCNFCVLTGHEKVPGAPDSRRRRRDQVQDDLQQALTSAPSTTRSSFSTTTWAETPSICARCAKR